MTRRIPKQLVVTAAAVIAAAALLSYAVLTRSEGPASPVAVLPGASATARGSSVVTNPTQATAIPGASATPAPSASGTEVPAPSLSDVTPTATPRSEASPTFPPKWDGKLVPASPTPSPRAQMWRLEGVVVDQNGNTVAGVCVAIGPHGCQPLSPRTDANGVYWADLPQADVTYDLHFFKDGFPVVDRSIHPFGNTRVDVLLSPQS